MNCATRRWGQCLVLAMFLPLGFGCATVSTAQGEPVNPRDPWESWNRNVFAFNDALDTHVLVPVATAYDEITPHFVRLGVQNFFNNFADAWSAVNNVLQGKLERAFTDVVRVGTNTVLGIGGLLDIAGEAGIEPTFEDFGQTLGSWGFGPGPYVVWPLFGPSSVRESFALPLDFAAGPSWSIHDTGVRWGLAALRIVDVRAGLLGASKFLDGTGLDKYSFVRDAYLQRRRNLVFDGDPPDEPSPAEPAEPEAPQPDSKTK